jgi:phage virion morphogenesis protein
MNNMSEGITGLERVIRRIGELATDTRQVERPLKAAGAYMLGSIERNFRAQGRPQKWQKLAAATLQRRRTGRGRGGAQILIDTARLKNSMSFRLVSAPGVEIGTNVIYGPRQHFGYPGGAGRGHSKTPARPFLMFQDEDYDALAAIFKRHVARL